MIASSGVILGPASTQEAAVGAESKRETFDVARWFNVIAEGHGPICQYGGYPNERRLAIPNYS